MARDAMPPTTTCSISIFGSLSERARSGRGKTMTIGSWLKRVTATASLLVPIFAAASADSQSAAEKASTTCQNCHGAGGNSVVATFPRLNGQQADYIAAQLKSFRSHSRADPHAVAYMWGMASQLDDAMIDALAKYFAAQPPTPPQSGGALA